MEEKIKRLQEIIVEVQQKINEAQQIIGELGAYIKVPDLNPECISIESIQLFGKNSETRFISACQDNNVRTIADLLKHPTKEVLVNWSLGKTVIRRVQEAIYFQYGINWY